MRPDFITNNPYQAVVSFIKVSTTIVDSSNPTDVHSDIANFKIPAYYLEIDNIYSTVLECKSFKSCR